MEQNFVATCNQCKACNYNGVVVFSPTENFKKTTSELDRLIRNPADTIFFIFTLTYVISDKLFL